MQESREVEESLDPQTKVKTTKSLLSQLALALTSPPPVHREYPERGKDNWLVFYGVNNTNTSFWTLFELCHVYFQHSFSNMGKWGKEVLACQECLQQGGEMDTWAGC